MVNTKAGCFTMAGFYFSKTLQDFFAKNCELLVITTESAILHQKTKKHDPNSY